MSPLSGAALSAAPPLARRENILFPCAGLRWALCYNGCMRGSIAVSAFALTFGACDRVPGMPAIDSGIHEDGGLLKDGGIHEDGGPLADGGMTVTPCAAPTPCPSGIDYGVARTILSFPVQPVSSFRVHRVAFSASQTELIFLSGQSVQTWDVQSATAIGTEELSGGLFDVITAALDGHGERGVVRRTMLEVDFAFVFALGGGMTGTWQGVAYSLALSPNGQALAVTTPEGFPSLDQHLTVLSVFGFDEIGRTQPFPSTRYAGERRIAFSCGGDFISAGDDQGMATVWSVPASPNAGTPLALHGSFQAQEEMISAVALDPRGDTLVVAAGDGSGGSVIRVWDMEGAIERYPPIALPSPEVWFLNFCPDGSTFSALAGQGALLFSTETGATLASLDAPSELHDVRFSDDGLRLAYAASTEVGIWEFGCQ